MRIFKKKQKPSTQWPDHWQLNEDSSASTSRLLIGFNGYSGDLRQVSRIGGKTIVGFNGRYQLHVDVEGGRVLFESDLKFISITPCFVRLLDGVFYIVSCDGVVYALS